MKNKWMKQNKRRLLLGTLAVFLIVMTLMLSIPGGVSINAVNKLVSIGVGQVNVLAYSANWYDDSQLQYGLWYQDINNPIIVGGYQVSFMKIYSIGGTTRVMELSTYPRAYKDTSPHVYTIDTPFTVVQDDLNDYYNSQYAQEGGYQYRPEIADGTNVYVDSRQMVFLIGESAKHYAGEPLPGNFPLWIESESLPTPPWVDQKNTTLPAVFQAVKGQLCTVTMHEAYYRQSDVTTWTKVPQTFFDQFVTAFNSTDTNIRINKITHNKDRTIIRVIYDRVIR